MSGFWIDIDPDSDSRDDGISDEGIKDHNNPYYHDQEGVVLVP